MVDNYISFVEVKYRTNNRYGMPYEAVNLKKQNKIIKVSKNYIKDKGLSYNLKYRYDVISIYNKEILLIKNAFGGF